MTLPFVEIAVKNSCSNIGEGLHWDEASQRLLYVDITSLDVHRWDSVTGNDTKVHLKDTVGFVVPRRCGGYMVGLGRRLSLLDWESGEVTNITEVDNDTGNRFNDGKCDAKGRLWAGTMGIISKPPHYPMGSLYSLDPDRTLRKQRSNVYLSSGLAWTTDSRTMFHIDTPTKKVSAFDFDLANGTISNERVAVDFEKLPSVVTGVPDGMTTDVEDKLWVACFGGGQVCRFDPETGALLTTISLPASQATSLCWGGKNLDELYVTTARILRPEVFFFEQEPLAGSVFRVMGLGVKGRPAFVYEG